MAVNAAVRISPLSSGQSTTAPGGLLLGNSQAFKRVWQRVDQVAATDATVLLLGETGTGKGLVARAIHDRSERRRGPFVEVNCATLPSTLIESELFGRERGAFTDAISSQRGRFELACGGTIFLDEIGELPVELQVKLLRVLQESTFERLGSPRTLRVNVRVIAATNRYLSEEVRQGRFRQDLYHRINVFPICLPALRDRAGDVELLAVHFVDMFSKRYRRPIHRVPDTVLNQLHAYDWPGNIRELEHVVERAIITNVDGVLRLDEPLAPCSCLPNQQQTARLIDVERLHITRVLENTAWRIEGSRGAASVLGLKPSTLRSRMVKLGIQRRTDPVQEAQ